MSQSLALPSRCLSRIPSQDKKLDKITAGLRGKTFNVEARRDACEFLVKYLWETRGMHNLYAVK